MIGVKMNMLNILHISDIHVQMKDKDTISDIVNKLVKDVLNVQKEKKIKIDLVCFTGDLIQCGEKAISGENQIKIAEEIVINPILKALGLERDRFIITPGNHEVDTTKIDGVIEKGLRVESLQQIDENISDMKEIYIQRLDYFYQWIQSYNDNIIKGKIGYAYLKKINNKNVGIVCLDTAWRSSGKGRCEKGLLYVGKKQINDLYKHIKDSDIKLCLMHHPIEWLSDFESSHIEKELMKFDIILCGHVHESDMKLICRQSTKTIYNIAGKLYPLDYAWGRAVDGYNGYAILNIDFDNSLCDIFLRTYYAKDRNDFDCALNLVDRGQVSYSLGSNKDEKQHEFDIVNGISNYFANMSETLTLIKEIDNYSPMRIEEIFVDPILSEKSEYVQESIGKDAFLSVNDLLKESNNIIIFGKKESGKTTLLQKMGLKYIEKYRENKRIPIYFDMRYLPTKKDKLTIATMRFIIDNIPDDININKEKIKEYIDLGKFVFLIDNVDTSEINNIHLLEDFIKDNEKNKFILTLKEEFFQSIDIKKLPDFTKEFKKLHINSFGKAQIRELVTKWVGPRNDTKDVSQVVEKINGYCDAINLSKTPFNISIFMVLWDSDRNFVPQNEGIVMENYMEVLLEKLSPKESERSTYSFKIKQHFLSKFAFCMFQKNEFYFSKDEFDSYVYRYHLDKGYKESESKFSTLFFNKGILSISDEKVVFSHTSFLEFYLAEYAKYNNDFLNLMLRKGNRVHFKNEICFYSGLVPDCKSLLDGMADTIIESIVENIDIVDTLNNFELNTNFKIKKDELIKKLNENRPTQKEIDDMTDFTSMEISPEEFREMKSPVILNTTSSDDSNVSFDDETIQKETEDFYSLVYIYGSVLKNAELLDNSDKINHLENYMYAMNILLGEIFGLEESIKKEFTYEKFKEEKPEEELTYDDFKKAKKAAIDILKMTLPIAMQQVILENIGTPKLEMAINDLMRQKKDKPFERFMLEFLRCDLNMGNAIVTLHDYINKESSEDILKLIFIKLIFYYRMRFFGDNLEINNNILDLIIELQIKLNPKESTDLTKAYKGNKVIIRNKIAKMLETSKNIDG